MTNLGRLHLGGPRSYKSKAYKDFVLHFEWFDNERDQIGKGEPHLFIRRRYAGVDGGNHSAVVVPMSQCHYYANSDGYPTRHLIMFAAGGCKELGLEPSKMNVRALADAIIDHIEDLVRMPPAPAEDKFHSVKAPEVGSASITVDGKPIFEQGIRLH